MTEPSTKPAKLQPRREAQVAEWESLTVAQREVGRTLCELLGELAASPFSKPPAAHAADQFLPRIDADRPNTTFLINGKRGSGKTTVLITLLDLWARRARNRDFVPTDDREQWLRSAPGVVPLRVVDLQPLPKKTRLLLHVAESLHKLIIALEDAGAPGVRPTPWDQARPELSCREAWRKFVASAALGWEYDPSKRSSVDPDAYAEELEHATSRGFNATECFHELVDSLVEEYPKRFAVGGPGEARTPLLVLPIDDADMNPKRVVEVLHLVRSFRHPRLAYLLTGDIDLFRITVRESLKRDVRADDNDEAWRSHGMRLLDDVTDQTLAKTIPPLHRRRISPLSGSERIQWLDPPELPAGPFLGSTWPAAIRDPILNLSLPDTMRGIRDLRGFLSDLLGSTYPEKQKLARAAHEIWNRAVDDDPRIFDTDKDRLRACVELTEAGALRVYNAPVGLSFGQRDLRDIDDNRVRLRAYRLWELRTPDRPLVERTLSAFCLATELGADAPGELWEPPHAGNYPTAFAAGLLSSGDLLLEIRWPVPDWPSYRDKVAFFSMWNPIAESSGEAAALHFLECIRSSSNAHETSSSDAADSNHRWKQILGWLRTLRQPPTPDATPRHRALHAWATDYAALLAAPESGLNTDVAQQLLQALRPSSDHHWWRTLVRRREERIALAILEYADGLTVRPRFDGTAQQTARTMLKSIDHNHPGHPWHDRSEPRPGPAFDLLSGVRAFVGGDYRQVFPNAEEVAAIDPLIRSERGADLLAELRRLALGRDAADLILWCLRDELHAWIPHLSLPWRREHGVVSPGNDEALRLAPGLHRWSRPDLTLEAHDVSVEVDLPKAGPTPEQLGALSACHRAVVRLARIRHAFAAGSSSAAPAFDLPLGSSLEYLEPWPGMQVSEPRAFPWPLPGRLELETLEGITREWGRLLETISASPSLADSGVPIEDVLAFNYANIVLNLVTKNSTSAPFIWRPDWRTLHSRGFMRGGLAYQTALAVWFDLLLFMAMPEAGLSTIAAQQILDLWLQEPRAVFVQQLRPLWCQRAGLAPAVPAPNNHPWLLRLEPSRDA